MESGELQGGDHVHVSKASQLAVLAQIFISSYSYMATFISIYFYWIIVSEYQHQRLYGTAFAMYAASTTIVAPIFGMSAKKFPSHIRIIYIFGTICDIVGNILFFFSATFSGGWGITLFFIGRFLSGINGANTVPSLTYLTRTSSMADRAKVMNNYRMAGFWGRLIAPAIGSGLMYWNTPVWTGPDAVYLTGFNATVIVSIILDVVGLCTVFFIQELPPVQVEQGTKVPFYADIQFRSTLRLVLELTVSMFASIFGIWMVFADLMPIASILFDVQGDNPGNIWFAFIPVFLGFLVAGIIMNRLVMPLPFVQGKEHRVLTASMLLMAAGLLGFIPYTQPEPTWVYYVAGLSLFIGYGMFQTVFRTVFSKVCGNTRHLPVLFAMLIVAQGLGSVVAPIISGALITVQDCKEHVKNSCRIHGLIPTVVIAIVAILLACAYQIIFMNSRLAQFSNRPSEEDPAFYQKVLNEDPEDSINHTEIGNDYGAVYDLSKN